MKFVSPVKPQRNERLTGGVQGLSDAQSTLYNTWSAIAIAPSAPFAMSEALPSEAWQVLDILLKGGQQ